MHISACAYTTHYSDNYLMGTGLQYSYFHRPYIPICCFYTRCHKSRIPTLLGKIGKETLLNSSVVQAHKCRCGGRERPVPSPVGRPCPLGANVSVPLHPSMLPSHALSPETKASAGADTGKHRWGCWLVCLGPARRPLPETSAPETEIIQALLAFVGV